MAAGNATRFRANKLTAELDGRSLIRRALEAIPRECFFRVVVVTQYPSIGALAEEFGFVAVQNPHPEYGISHTVRLGTQALADCDAIVFTVADQPLLRSASVERLISAWRAQPQCIVGAVCGGRRGNPNLFPRAFFPALTALSGDVGGSAVIRANSDRFLPVELPPEELTDVDTVDALAHLQRKEVSADAAKKTDA